MKQFIIILVLLTLFSCGKQNQTTAPSSAKNPLRIARVIEEPDVIRIPGTVQTEDTAIIASKFAGFIQRVPAKNGMHAKQGQLLVVMDDRNLSAQSDRVSSMRTEALEGTEEAKNHLEAARAQKDLAASTFARIERLFQKKSASLQEFEEAKARRDAADAELNAAEKRVAQTEAKIEQLQSEQKDVAANLSYVRIAAPFDGVVTSVDVDPGEFVNPGQSLVRIESPGTYQVLFMIEQELLPLFNEGALLDVEIQGEKDVHIKGTVTEIGPSMKDATRTFPIKANLSTQAHLRSGTSAIVILPIKTQKSLWIPETFLNRQVGLETVFVRRGNEWERTLVRSGKTRKDQIEILSGLNAGDEIALFEEQQ
ncbi:MAG TPA: efflux RND transporter periplasmic adaptor subunit [Acidobacteriota bacterium]|nr:efflux RND transporter periplasmic adaptor subunit [Acidobacteriota bacterium]